MKGAQNVKVAPMKGAQHVKVAPMKRRAKCQGCTYDRGPKCQGCTYETWRKMSRLDVWKEPKMPRLHLWKGPKFCFFVPHRSRMEAKGPRANGAVPPQKILFRKKFSKCPHRFFARCPVFSSSKMQLTIVFQTEKLTSEHDFWELFQTICLKIIFKHYS